MNDVKIKIDDKEFEVSYQGNNVSVNQKPYKIDILHSKNNNIFTFTVNNKIHQVEIKEGERNKSKILLNGFEYEVDVTDELTELLDKFMKQSGKNGNSGGGKIKAPMPGMVIKILAEENQEVQKGDKVIIVEAMKMENAIQSPVSGIVKKIPVSEGQAVEKDAILIEIEETT